MFKRWKYDGVFHSGDIIIAKSGSTLFPEGFSTHIAGKTIGKFKKGEIAIVIEIIESSNDTHIEINEHVIKILCVSGVGWTWRGFFNKI